MSESFDKFQIEEYSNISKAHFETNNQIAVFFRYYLIIASAPAIIFIWYEKKEKLFEQLFLGKVDTDTTLFIGFFLLFISIIGVLTSFYLISFRLDSVLYARTVNGIRKYFYDKERISNENHYRVLPKQINQPKYSQKHTFSMIVWSIGLIDAAYFSIGLRIIAIKGFEFYSNYLGIHFWIIKNFNFFWAFGFGVLLFLIHIFYYNYISEYRNFSYMKTLTIGVDIDGVLNKHRDTFCTLLFTNEHIKMTLWADEITTIPVHQIAGKGIERKDEWLIFNDPNYWEKQVTITEKESLSALLKELRHTYGYKIRIFSYRAWPELTYYPLADKDECLRKWFLFGRENKWLYKIIAPNIKQNNFLDQFTRYWAIHRITKKWLIQNAIKSDSLVIEKAGIDKPPKKSPIYRLFNSNFKTRYYYSKKYSYRYFVEDDLKNATKLASNCEYVFLMDQPYNRCEGSNFSIPPNIIRVNSWAEIKEKIKELG